MSCYRICGNRGLKTKNPPPRLDPALAVASSSRDIGASLFGADPLGVKDPIVPRPSVFRFEGVTSSSPHPHG